MWVEVIGFITAVLLFIFGAFELASSMYHPDYEGIVLSVSLVVVAVMLTLLCRIIDLLSSLLAHIDHTHGNENPTRNDGT